MANTIKANRLLLATSTLAALALASQGDAQTRTAVLSTHGAWVQRTSGLGMDQIVYVVNTVVYRPNGAWKFRFSSTHEMGSYNDHGGANAQEVAQDELSTVALEPGERAEIIVLVFASSDGGFYGRVGGRVKGLLESGLTSGDPLVTALSAGGYAASTYLDRAVRGSEGFVGSVRESVQYQGGGLHWQFAPGTNAWYRGQEPDGSYSVGVRNSRAEYWLKIGMAFS